MLSSDLILINKEIHGEKGGEREKRKLFFLNFFYGYI